LTDPVSALYFGQFILGCSVHFASIEQLSKNRDIRNLCWRLDQVPPFLPPNESDSLIENWLCSLPTAENAEYVVDGSRSSRLSKRLSLRPSILHRLQSLSAFMSRNKTSSSTRDRSASTDLLQVPPRSASGSSWPGVIVPQSMSTFFQSIVLQSLMRPFLDLRL
jgi:hypothetical protein